MTEIPPELLDYLNVRKQEHAVSVARVLNRMTDRERRLVREAAVMGYVRGRMSVPGSIVRPTPMPPDSAVVVEVLAAALAMPDLYPVVDSLAAP